MVFATTNLLNFHALGGTVHLEWDLQQGVGDNPGPARSPGQADRRGHGARPMAGVRTHARRPPARLPGLPAHPGEAAIRHRHQHVSSGRGWL